MKLLGLAPYSLELDITPTSLLHCIILSGITVVSIFVNFILDVKFLTVKGYELIPAIILYMYNIVLSIYICYDLVQNLRKHAKSKKILLTKLVHIDYLITTQLHLPLSHSNAKMARSVLYQTFGNLLIYTCLAIVTYSFEASVKLGQFAYLITNFVPIANINAILILLLTKINLMRERFKIINDFVKKVPGRLESLHKDDVETAFNNKRSKSIGKHTTSIENSNNQSIKIHDHIDEMDDNHSGNSKEKQNNPSERRYGVPSNSFKNAARRVPAANRPATTFDNNDIKDADFNSNAIMLHSNACLRRTSNDGVNGSSDEIHQNIHSYENNTQTFKEFDFADDEMESSLNVSKDDVFHIQPHEETHATNRDSFEDEYNVEHSERSRHDYYRCVDSVLGSRALTRLRCRMKNSKAESIVVSGKDIDDLNYLTMSREKMEEIHRGIIEMLENVVKIHFDICELSTDLNNRYSYQILAILCLHFLSLCSTIYSSIALGIATSKTGLGWHEGEMILYHIVWLVSEIYWILLITRTSHYTMEESKEAKSLIHKYVIEETFPEIEHELDLLVRHLEKHKVQFTANGFFDVDYKIYCMMVGTAATYWMVLVQLDL